MNDVTPNGELDELYMALGKLVVQSSVLEKSLRCLVGWLVDSDDAAVLFDGQSVDWLVASGRAVLGEVAGLGDFSLQDADRFDSALLATRELFRVRNRYVHGEWKKESGLDECVPRARNSTEDSRIFYVVRSRLRKGLEEHQVAVIDLEELADKMHALDGEIRDALRIGNRLRRAMYNLNSGGSHGLSNDMDVMLVALARRSGKHLEL